MNILTVTQSGKAYILTFNGQRLILLNQKALWYHLKHHVKLTTTQCASFIHMFEYEMTISIQVA